MKKASHVWARDRFSGFQWQEGYAAFSVSPGEVPRVIAYIANQEDHRRHLSSADELRAIMAEFGMDIDERFFD